MEFRKMLTMTLFARQQKRHKYKYKPCPTLIGLSVRCHLLFLHDSALIGCMFLEIYFFYVIFLFLFFKLINLFELEANYFTVLWWFLPYIDMNQPWVYMWPPSWTALPPLSPSHPSGLSQCTGFECPVSCIELGLVIYFTYGNIHVSVLFSQIIPPSPSPIES